MIINRVYTHFQKQIWRTFPRLSRTKIDFSTASIITLNPLITKISKSILLTVLHIFPLMKILKTFYAFQDLY